jgi:hypothetical protein
LPALAISAVALIVAVGGGTFAIASSSGGQVKKIAKKVADRQIKKRAPRLSVRHATTADEAANAAHAASAGDAAALAGLGPTSFERAGHLVQISARMANTDPDRTILQAGPFTVTAHCAPQNPQQNFIRAFVTTSENDSAVRGVNIFGEEGGNADLDVGAQVTIGQYQESGTPPPPAGPFEATMNMVSPSGTNVFVSLVLGTRLFSDNASQRTACVFAGYAVVS